MDNPKTASYLLKEGNRLRESQEFEKAIELYKEAIELDSKNHWYYHHIGDCLTRLKKFNLANEYYRKSVEINPAFPWSYHCLAQLVYWEKNFAEAIDLVKKAIAINPNIPEFYILLGDCFAKQKRWNEAIEVYEKALELNPDLGKVKESLEKAKKNIEPPFDSVSQLVDLIVKREAVYESNLVVENPIVSIISSFYNVKREYFLETVDSVKKQTWQNFEWIIVEDCSTETESLELFNSLVSLNPKIRTLSHSSNKGLAEGRNTGIKEAKGKYLFFLDTDDIIDPTYIEKCVLFLESHPDFSLVNSHSVGFQDEEYWWNKEFNTNRNDLIEANKVTGRLLYRTEDFKVLGGFDPELKFYEDWDRWLKAIVNNQKGWTISEYLDCYRRTSSGLLATSRSNSVEETKVKELIQNRYRDFFSNNTLEDIELDNNLFRSDRVSWKFEIENNLKSIDNKINVLCCLPTIEENEVTENSRELIEYLASKDFELTLVISDDRQTSVHQELYKQTPHIYYLTKIIEKDRYLGFIYYAILSRNIDVLLINDSPDIYPLLPLIKKDFPELKLINYSPSKEREYLGFTFGRYFTKFLDRQIFNNTDIAEGYGLNGNNNTKICSTLEEIELVIKDRAINPDFKIEIDRDNWTQMVVWLNELKINSLFPHNEKQSTELKEWINKISNLTNIFPIAETTKIVTTERRETSDKNQLYNNIEPESSKKTYKEYHQLGSELLKQENLEGAEKAFSMAIKLNPNYSWSHHCLSQVLNWQERPYEAISACNRAIEIDPNQIVFYNQLGEIFAAIGKITDTIDCYKKSLSIAEGEGETYIKLGEVLITEKLYEEAEYYFKKAIELKPNRSWSYHGLGESFSKREKWTEAETAYKKAIELKDDYSWSYVHLVNALIQQEKFTEAKKYNSLALEKFPNHPNSIVQQGIIENDSSDINKKKEESWELLTKPDPKKARLAFELGEQLANRNEWSEAEKAYLRAIQLNPGDQWYQSSLAVALSQQKKWSSAISAYKSAIELKSNSPWLYKSLGEALYHNKEYLEAVEAYNQALAIEPGNYWYCNNLAHSLFHLERWQEAEVIYQKCLDINPSNPQLQTRFGQTLLKQEKWIEAIEKSDRAIKKIPEHPSLYKNRIQALQKLGRLEEANKTIKLKQIYEEIKELREDIWINPDRSPYHKNLGDKLAQLEKWAPAAIAYKRAIQLDPNPTPLLYSSLGEAQFKIGYFLESEKSYIKAIQLRSPETFWLYKGYGKVLFKLGKWSRAIDILNRAVSFQQDEPQIEDYLGSALCKLEKWTEAIAVYQKAVTKYSSRPWYCEQFYISLGNSFSKIEQWKEAILAYEKAISIQPKEFKNYHKLGDAYFQVQELSKAEDSYRKALSQNSEHLSWSHKLAYLGWHYHYLGDSFTQENKLEEAERSYSKAKELNPDCVIHSYYLASVLEKQEKLLEANKIYRDISGSKTNISWLQKNIKLPLEQIAKRGLVICISSKLENKDKQQAIRDTWVTQAKQQKIPYFFIISKPSTKTHIDGDIIYLDTPENENNDELKTYKLWDFIYHQTFYSHALHINDNCYVDIDNLQNYNFENQDYTRAKRKGKQKKNQSEHRTGYFLNRYAIEKFIKNIDTLTPENKRSGDKLIDRTLEKQNIKPVYDPNYIVGIEKSDSESGNRLVLAPGYETFYPHKSNNVIVFYSDNAPGTFHQIHQQREKEPEEINRATFLKNFYYNKSNIPETICLKRIDNKEIKTSSKDVLCFIVERNESLRLPYLLNYYRSKGVSKFFIVDNNSTDDTLNHLLQQPDVYLWHTTRSYADAKWGVQWTELLLKNYGVDRWCLLVDSDEILYYHNCEIKNIPQLCYELELQKEEALSTVLLDMYSKDPIKDARYITGQNFLDTCSYFDRKFYTSKAVNGGPEQNVTAYFGGLRNRIFGGDLTSFCINKTPLIKYNFNVRLYEGFHWIGNIKIARQTGCLLHFKYFSTFHDYAKQEAKRGEHWNGGSEYIKYAKKLDENNTLSFYNPHLSVKLENSKQLQDLGIIRRCE